jgi:hypothetical protein
VSLVVKRSFFSFELSKTTPSQIEADPEARVADIVMPTLPISIMNVMDGMRGNQEMIVSSESNVDETATAPLIMWSQGSSR